jgi:hypothetical protein
VAAWNVITLAQQESQEHHPMLAPASPRSMKSFGPIYRSLLLAVCVAAFAPALAAESAPQPDDSKPWSFAAIADCRRLSERPKGVLESALQEIRDNKVASATKFAPAEFVLGCGDITLAIDDHANWNLWVETFKDAKDKPCFFPVIGNWDDEDVAFNKKVVLPAQRNVSGDDPWKYYVDWKNVRLIISHDLKYVEGLIVSAPEKIQHIFVADHYPIFPRYAHEAESRADDATFWNMLVKHHDKVRALFVGHTHHYSRMRVADPKSAHDVKSFPDEEGGVYQIDCGNAGRGSHGEKVATIVEVMVEGKKLRFRAVQAEHAKPSEFKVADEWTVEQK